MSNKLKLQENNSNLEEVITAIQSLPIENTWEGSEIIIPGTESIIIPAYTNKELTVSAIEPVDTLKDFFGYEKISTGQIRPNGYNTVRLGINHNLNVIPEFILFHTKEDMRINPSNQSRIKMLAIIRQSASKTEFSGCVFDPSSGTSEYIADTGHDTLTETIVESVTTTRVVINIDDFTFYFGPTTYNWIAMA